MSWLCLLQEIGWGCIWPNISGVFLVAVVCLLIVSVFMVLRHKERVAAAVRARQARRVPIPMLTAVPHQNYPMPPSYRETALV